MSAIFHRLDRRGLFSLVLWVTSSIGMLVLIAILNNNWRIWDTAAFCGSYADFMEPPVPEVCLSFPLYFRLMVTHPPYILPAVIIGAFIAILYYRSR